MKERRPFIITFLGDLNIFFAVILFLQFIMNVRSVLEQFSNAGLGNLFAVILALSFSFLVPMALLISAIGYLKLRKWGYWAFVAINLMTLLIEGIRLIQSYGTVQPLGMLQAVISLVFIIPTHKYFINENTGKEDCVYDHREQIDQA